MVNPPRLFITKLSFLGGMPAIGARPVVSEMTRVYVIRAAFENQAGYLFSNRTLRVSPRGDIFAGVGIAYPSPPPQNHAPTPMMRPSTMHVEGSSAHRLSST